PAPGQAVPGRASPRTAGRAEPAGAPGPPGARLQGQFPGRPAEQGGGVLPLAGQGLQARGGAAARLLLTANGAGLEHLLDPEAVDHLLDATAQFLVHRDPSPRPLRAGAFVWSSGSPPVRARATAGEGLSAAPRGGAGAAGDAAPAGVA